MWPVTSRNRDIKERERELKKEIQEQIDNGEKIEFTKTDILAMIIAAFQIMIPIILIVAFVFTIFVYVFTNFIL